MASVMPGDFIKKNWTLKATYNSSEYLLVIAVFKRRHYNTDEDVVVYVDNHGTIDWAWDIWFEDSVVQRL